MRSKLVADNEPRFQREVFEHIIDTYVGHSMIGNTLVAGFDDWSRSALDIRKAGVYLQPDQGGMEWSPACDLDSVDSPDPLSAPVLAFPFTARELAAWMLSGWGEIMRPCIGEWGSGPDPDALARLGMRGVKARDALTRAYAAYREAEQLVGVVDAELLEMRIAAHHKHELAHNRAIQSHNWKAPSLDEQESDSRRKLYRAKVDRALAELRESQRAENEAREAWRKAMVNCLLAPIVGTTADQVSVRLPEEQGQESQTVASAPSLPLGLVYWRRRLYSQMHSIDLAHGGHATPMQAIAALKALRDPRMTAPAHFSDTPDVLHWKTDERAWASVKSKTVGNALTAARKWLIDTSS